MENCCYSDGANWVQCRHVALNGEFPYPVPWPLAVPPPHEVMSASTRSFQFHGFPPLEGVAEDGGGTATASKSHSQAEKRRRDRINTQLSTLRKLIPKSDKMDKAALLGSVIDHVKDLKRRAMEVSKACSIPTEVDEVTIDYDHGQDVNMIGNVDKREENILIRVSFCCDDRPELFSELIQVLKGLRLTVVKADIASVGGRIKSVLVLCTKALESDQVGVCLMSTLKQSLKLVLSKIASSSSMATNCRIRSKRQRFFLPSPYSQ
ncbi:transcription factor bHLH51-like [Juglans microcarpa x Juglans regia]|uniref:transcription factor bHLH51-like n=1 Tax=Juglans microcarpa x Juglans regia TaxID=2249226 RepID=UPI001B7E1D1A|nr:transcription factor bHLH51-like [Juglans microcarpa x Juglans regia]